jgi:hypothetical protein
MGTEKYISEVKLIKYPVEKVYVRLSDLRNIEKLFNIDKFTEVKDKIPGTPDINIENFLATENECSFNIKSLGNVGLMIVDKESNKMVKLAGNKGLPFDFNCWLQLVTVNEESCKVRITLHAEMSPMIRMMVNKPLEEGVNRLADVLTRIDFA